MQDWVGDKNSVFACNGASSHSNLERSSDDYYATDPEALKALLEVEEFSPYIWECACGGGHLSRVLIDNGYKVKSSDITYRGFEGTEIIDFLSIKNEDINKDYPRDIITNPPYKYAKEFVEQALKLSADGTKVAMFLKLTFLEGKARRALFKKYPPKVVYVFPYRVKCAPNGDFSVISSSAVAYTWFIWEKGFKGDPIIKWLG